MTKHAIPSEEIISSREWRCTKGFQQPSAIYPGCATQGIARRRLIRWATRSLLFLLLFAVSHSAFGQIKIDSIPSDSTARVILSEEVSALLPSEYADLALSISTKYAGTLKKAEDIIDEDLIRSLRFQYQSLVYSSEYIIRNKQYFTGVESLLARWNELIEKVKNSSKDLKSTTDALLELKKDVAERKLEWDLYAEVLSYSTHPEEIDEYVATARDTLDSFSMRSTNLIDDIILAYTSLVDLQIDCENYLANLSQIKSSNLDSLISARTVPIWNLRKVVNHSTLQSEIGYYRENAIEDSVAFLKSHNDELLRALILFIGSLVILYWTRSMSLKVADSQEPLIVRNDYILKIPFVIAVIVTLIDASFVLAIQPPLVDLVIDFILLICSSLILLVTIRRSNYWMIVVLAVLFLLDTFSNLADGDYPLGRIIALVVSLGIAGTMFQAARLYHRSKDTQSDKPLRFFYYFLSVFLVTICLIAFVANILGYGNLALVLNTGAIRTFFVAVVLVATFRTFVSVVYHFLYSPFGERSNIIRDGKESIFNQVVRYTRLVTVGLLVFYSLRSFFLWKPIMNFLTGIWEFGYTFGEITITVGSIINVFLIVIAFWIVGSAIRTLLNKEVFARVDLPRGVANAGTSIIQYIFVILGFFMALASTGFELAQLGILAGALGVGVGFGLQSIVNNFLSGLILIFERPIAVGDIIEVDNTLGTVTSIGIRSSTIRQFNGDEAIIPNADLISKKVNNWTLSNTLRRYTMTFQTPRDVDPDMVIRLCTEAAQGSTGVVDDPPVKTYFDGMVEQTLQFYVNYWGKGEFLELKSEVQHNVFKALRDNGVGIPVPVQIEVQHLDELKDWK